MADQRQLSEAEYNAAIERVVASAPDGLSREQFDDLVNKELTRSEGAMRPVASHAQPQSLSKIAPAQSHRDSSPREGDYKQYGPLAQSMRDAYEPSKNQQQFKENAPGIAAGVATALVPPSALYTIPAALAAGSAASYARGDAPKTAAWEGGKQALLEGVPLAARAALGKGAHWLMNANVSKRIADNFPNVDIPQQMLDRGALPGSKSSARKIESLSHIANASRDVAAKQVPPMDAMKTIEGYKSIYQEAVQSREWDRAAKILDEAKKVLADIKDPRGGVSAWMGQIEGPGVMTRKTLKQNQGAAALDDPFQKTLIPDLRKAEATALTQHVRKTPGAAEALDESQALMAVDKVMKDKANRVVGNSANLSGLPTALATSPIGTSGLAHVVNQGRRVVDPNVARLLASLMTTHSPEEQ